MECLQPAVLGVESALELAIAQRKRTVYRLDGGSGTDENLRWLLQRHYQTVAKGFSGKRANVLARQVQRWDPYDETSFLGTVPDTLNLGRPVELLVRKRLQQGHWKHSYYVSTLAFPSKQAFFDRYSQRGAAEIEQFRNDKSGLHLSARRMRSFEAQKALILLTDLAHNLLADFQRRALADSPFAQWGLKRIVRDLLAIPGRLYLLDGQLKRIELLATHPHAAAMIICLEKYCSGRFGQ
jgi:Transposase DDE domain group 1